MSLYSGTRPLRRKIAFLFVAFLCVAILGCADSTTDVSSASPSPTSTPAVARPADSDSPARLETLDRAIKQLTQSADNLKKEVAALDASRVAFETERQALRVALGLDPSESKAKDRAPQGFMGWLWRIILLVIIVIALISIIRIFLSRWNEPDDDEVMIEKKNELGSIKMPAAAETLSQAESSDGKSDSTS